MKQSRAQLKRSAAGWEETARQYAQNEAYYREQRDNLAEVCRAAAFNLISSPPNPEAAYEMLARAFIQYHVPQD